jgi:CBS domain containing-hemolysin-like protein
MVDQAEAFQSLRVADVMTPRADIVAVEVSVPFEAVVAQFTEAEHSRMPIYRETLDDPVGVVHVKDVFRLLASDDKRPAPPTRSCTGCGARRCTCPPRCGPPTCCCACAPAASTWPWSSTSSAAPTAW